LIGASIVICSNKQKEALQETKKEEESIEQSADLRLSKLLILCQGNGRRAQEAGKAPEQAVLQLVELSIEMERSSSWRKQTIQCF